MKNKIIFIVFIFLLMPIVKAASYNSNIAGIQVTPSKNENDPSCVSPSYWIGYTQAQYKFQGLRISFYDEDGKQVGSTFDSWDWGDTFATEYLQTTSFTTYNADDKITLEKLDIMLSAIDSIEKEYEKIKDMKYIAWDHESYLKIVEQYNKIKGLSLLVVKYNELLGVKKDDNFLYSKYVPKLETIVAEGKNVKKIIENLKNKVITATIAKFDVYIRKVNHSLNYYSKVDYLKRGITAETAKDFSTSDMLDGGYYIYYHDTVAHASNTKELNFCGNGTNMRCYEYFGNLLYSSQGSAKTELRNYLTDENVMSRYLRLAGASSLVDIKEGNYTMLLEPVVSISSCRGGAYSGRYTSTDIGYVLAVTNPETNESLRQFPGWLKIEKELNLAGLNFTVADPAIYVPSYFYNPTEILSKLGTGMSAILGTEVCGENCISSKRHPIVYRTFDLNNPFLNKDGSVRDLSEKSNWYDKVDTIETDIYSKEPFLTITLDPATIKKIRANNKTINYSSLNKTTCSKFRTDYSYIFNPQTNFCN